MLAGEPRENSVDSIDALKGDPLAISSDQIESYAFKVMSHGCRGCIGIAVLQCCHDPLMLFDDLKPTFGFSSCDIALELAPICMITGLQDMFRQFNQHLVVRCRGKCSVELDIGHFEIRSRRGVSLSVEKTA